MRHRRKCPQRECPQREFVIGRDEDNGRHIAGRHAFQNVEAVHAGHLYVEKHQIRRMRFDRFQRLTPVAALCTNLDIREFRETYFKSTPRQLFVINDQCFQHLLPQMAG